MGRSASNQQYLLLLFVFLFVMKNGAASYNSQQRKELSDKVLEMFHHAFDNYMENAYPADELMPLSCRGRYRSTKPSRGDIDDSLGDFSLTLVDSLDTLVVLGLYDKFEDAVRKVIKDVTFDRDIVVSVFETNIRMLGGLLGGHVMAEYLRTKHKRMSWYNDELLHKAKDLGYRLLPAFNTSTGIPYPRVNLKFGVKQEMARTGHERDTCTACAGTMILEFAALTRLTGEPIFEARAHNALEYLWRVRHRSSNLVGTVINIHNGEWVRRESGVGAGIDSYYEYLLKAYIMLGDETYLDRFNKHYEAINKYITQGPLLVDVHMHRPLSNSRNFMDSLGAFWPGLQVLKGDLKPAIEIHEMLYQVTQRHNFLPEAFTTDFRVHWGQHPLRPEFVESTYFLYKATNDPHYLDVGKSVMDNLEKHARVPCGFAAIKDVTTGVHEDQMDSFVLAETFKYLYLLFTEPENISLNVDNYIFTTEAHLLPLSLSMKEPKNLNVTKEPSQFNYNEDDNEYERSCPNNNEHSQGNLNYFVEKIRNPLKDMVENLCPKPRARTKPRLKASSFIAGDAVQVQELQKMGIRIVTMSDGRVQLLHTASEAASVADAEDGMLFMQEMIELSKTQAAEQSGQPRPVPLRKPQTKQSSPVPTQQEPRVVQFLSMPYLGHESITAGPAQFGTDLKNKPGVQGIAVMADPFRSCEPLKNTADVHGKIVLVERGDCMFVDKARHLQSAGAIAGIVIDNNVESSAEISPIFAMSGDGKDDVSIPLVFLFRKEFDRLKLAMDEVSSGLIIYVGLSPKRSDDVLRELSGAKDQSSRNPTPETPVPYDKVSNSNEQQSREEVHQGIQMTYHTPAGDALFTIKQGADKRLHLDVNQETLKLAGKPLMVMAVQQVVKMIQQHPIFEKMPTNSQTEYLFTLGKLLEASFKHHSSEQEFEKKVMEILQTANVVKRSGPLSKITQSMESSVQKVLNEYIEQLITKVLSEVSNSKDGAQSTGTDDQAQGNTNEEPESANSQVDVHDSAEDEDVVVKFQNPESVVTIEVTEHKDELPSYATDDEINDVSGNQQKRIKKAPKWLKLGPGEVFITANGDIYSNEFYDVEHSFEENDDITRVDMPGIRYAKSMAEKLNLLNQPKLDKTGYEDLTEVLGNLNENEHISHDESEMGEMQSVDDSFLNNDYPESSSEKMTEEEYFRSDPVIENDESGENHEEL